MAVVSGGNIDPAVLLALTVGMSGTTANRAAGTLITLVPAAGELGHLLRAAIDAEQVGASRIHLAADQPRHRRAGARPAARTPSW